MNKFFALIVAAGFASTAAAQQPTPQVMPSTTDGQPGAVMPSTGTVIGGPTYTPGVVYGQPMMGTTYPSNVIQGAPVGPMPGQVYSQPYTTGMAGQAYTQPYTNGMAGQAYTQPYTTGTIYPSMGMTYPTMGTMYNRPYTSYGTSGYVPAYNSNGMTYGNGYSMPYSTNGYTGTSGYSNGSGGMFSNVVGAPVRIIRGGFTRIGGVFGR